MNGAAFEPLTSGLQTERRHFSILVYPFRSAFDQRAQIHPNQGNWRHLWSRFDDEAVRSFVDDTFFFLPHLREFLFTDAAAFTGQEADLSEMASRVRMASAKDVLRKTPKDVLVRLTLASEILSVHNPFHLVAQDSVATPPMAFRVEWIDLFLFPQDVAFIAFKISVDPCDAPSEHVRKLLCAIRPLFSPTVGIPLPKWRSATGMNLEGRQFVEFLLQGWTSVSTAGQADLETFIQAVQGPNDRPYTLTGDGQTYGDAFRLYTFMALPEAEWTERSAAPFATAWDRFVYEIATTFPLTDPAFFPHSRAAAKFTDDMLTLWDNWRAAILADHVVFAARSDEFTSNVLSHNVESDYFHLYMLSLFVKIRLNFFFGDLIQRNPSLLRNLFAARSIATSFIRFQNEFWFPEVTHKPQGSLLYDRFQSVHLNPSLYAELSEKINNLVSHLEQRYQLATAVLIALLVAPRTFQEIFEGILWLIDQAFR